MVMVGMIVVTANRSHIALDFLVTRVSRAAGSRWPCTMS
jgi:TRAP-type C4-dicarboxylate transport system permease small subunit